MPATPSNDATTQRVTDGLIDRKALAADLNRSERTVIRYERLGMPYISLGMLRLYQPEKVRAWILGHERRPEAPRRGRPSRKRSV